MSDGGKTSIRTPQEWTDEAEEMGIAKTEYLRRMIRAGRLQWGYDHETEPENEHVQLYERDTPQPIDVKLAIEEIVRRNLSTTAGIDDEEIVELVLDDLEQTTLELLEELKDQGEADYAPTKGGWVKQS